MARKRGNLIVPHVQVGAERVAQHEHRRALGPLDLRVELGAVRLDHRHGRLLVCLERSRFHCCELPVDELLRDALVGEGIEQAFEFVGAEVRGHARVLA